MSRDIRETLKNNTPEFLKDYPDLVNFLDAAGQFLNETKDVIEAFDYSHDYKKSDRYALDSRLKSIGFEIPPYIDEKVSRTVLRDAIQAFIRKGTTDSLLWVLKIIGTTPKIRQAWLPSPAEIRKGQKVNLQTGALERYDVDAFTYTDFLYGEAVTTDNGTYFTGYEYDDVFEEDALENIPIIGENYKETPDGYVTPVEKMPYIIVRITDQNFNVATEPYIDPETGEEYEYGLPEEYRAVEALIDYFLYQTTRPANVRILLVASVQEIEEAIALVESYQEEHSHEPTSEADSAGLQSMVTDERTGTISSVNVGDPIIIGKGSPYFSQFGETEQVLDVNGSGSFVLRDYENFTSYTVNTVFSTTALDSRKIPVRATVRLEITAPVDQAIEIYGLENFDDILGNGVLIDSVNTGQTKTVNIPVEYHGVFLTAETSDIENHPLKIYYD